MNIDLETKDLANKCSYATLVAGTVPGRCEHLSKGQIWMGRVFLPPSFFCSIMLTRDSAKRALEEELADQLIEKYLNDTRVNEMDEWLESMQLPSCC